MLRRMSITSSENPRIKGAVNLRDRRGRDRQSRVLIDGHRELEYAIRHGVQIETVFVVDNDPDYEIEDWLALLEAEKTPIDLLQISGALFDRLTFGDRSSGVVAVGIPPNLDWQKWELPKNALIGIVENCEKPGNIGAIARTADAAGLDGLLFADPITDLFNPNAIRASMGTVFSHKIASGKTAEIIRWLADNDFQVFTARVDGAADYFEVDFTGRTAIILGNEAKGLSDAWNLEQAKPIKLPMYGIADSLNVSTTAAVLFYEAVRQRLTKRTS